MLNFQGKDIIVNYEVGFHRDEIVPLHIDCALQGYFYCEECEAYTFHLSNYCDVCSN
jgi:hypothetical protein